VGLADNDVSKSPTGVLGDVVLSRFSGLSGLDLNQNPGGLANMGTESFFSLACAGLIAMLFGLAMCFAGYRLFYLLLPIWGFVFGMAFGAQTMQALFGSGFLATVSSWVVGFVVGAVFAISSYLWFNLAIAILAGSVGYSVVVGLVMALGLPMGWLLWLIGLSAGVVVAIVALVLNLQKWVVIVGTAILGAETIIGTFVLMFNPVARTMANPIQAVMQTSPLLWILVAALVVLGVVTQFASSTRYTLVSYSRM
jgi:hypothetical protein